MNEADIRKLDRDRIGQAYCTLNKFEWDPIFGDPPEGFDQMTKQEKHVDLVFNRAWDLICDIMPEKERSFYWWTLELGNTKEEWDRWWNTEQKRCHTGRKWS